MNSYNGAHSNPRVPSPTEKRKISGDSRSEESPVSKSSSRLSPVEILQRPMKNINEGSKDCDSDSSLHRSVIAGWKPSATIIPDSSSEGEEQLKSPSETERDVQRKRTIKTPKLFNLSLPQKQQYNFGELPNLTRNLGSSFEESKIPQTPPPISPLEASKIYKSAERLREIRAHCQSTMPRKENTMGQFSILPPSKSLLKRSEVEEIVDVEAVVDHDADVILKTVVIDISDEEAHSTASGAIPNDDVNGAECKNVVEIIENESDASASTPTQLITPIKKKRNRNRGNNGDDKSRSIVEYVDLDSPVNSPKSPNSGVTNLNKADGDFRGFGAAEKSSEFQDDGSKDNGKIAEECEKTGGDVEPEDRQESHRVLSPGSDKNKFTDLKPCSVDCSEGRKEADHVLEKRLSGGEEDKGNLGKLRSRKESTRIDKVEETPIQNGKTEQSEEKKDAPELEKKKRGRKPGLKCKPKITTNSHQVSASSGHLFRVLSKKEADDKDDNLLRNHEPLEKKRRGRKPGGKNKPSLKPKSKLDPKSRGSPGRVVKKGRKRQIKDKPVENLENNNDGVIAGCCISGGCIHGLNHRKPGRLPSLPENPEYIFAEQKFFDNLDKINEQMLALETKDDTADSGTGCSCSPIQKAIIEFPPTVIVNADKNDREIEGMKILLPSLKLIAADNSSSETGEHEDSPQSLEDTSEDTYAQKPKIIHDEVFPKGTLNHVFSQLNTGTIPSNQVPGSSKHKEFGIRSTLPSRKSLNPSSSCENMWAKIAAAFNNNWKRIPEIAALLEPPSKRRRCVESSDEDSMEIPEIKVPEKRQSLLSESVSNIDLQNGHESVLLNGLFSDPHVINRHSSKSGRRKFIEKKCDNEFEDKSRSIPRLTKKNLSMFDDAHVSTDVISHIMSQMQPPGKMVTKRNILNTLDTPKKSSENSKHSVKHEETVEMKLKSRNRKRAADIQSIKSPESKRMKKKGKWSINNNNDDDDASSCTSNESRPSAFASHRSLLSSFGEKGIDGKNELIAAWLDKDVTNNENSHSPNSARTYVKTPDETFCDDDIQRDGPHRSNSLSPSKVTEEDLDDKSQGNESDNSSSHSSTKTITKSLKESSSSGIGTEERDKQNSFETEDGESTRDATELLTKTNSTVDNNNKDKDEEDEDALRLDYEEDDFLFDEPLEYHEDEEDVEKKQPSPKSSPVHHRVPPLKVKRTVKNPIAVATLSDKSPKRNPPTIAIVGHKSPNDNVEAFERGSSASDHYQMANFERFASQTAREFNDQYSVQDEADAHGPDDDYDPYAPVQTQGEAECRIIFPKDPSQYFRGLCFPYLQKGICTRLDCPFHNKQYSFHLQNLPKAPPALIESVLTHAIGHQYFHLLPDIYPENIKRLELRGIERILRKIHSEAQKLKTKTNNYSAVFYQNSMRPTVDALILKNYSPKTIINILNGCFLFNDDEDRKKLMRTITATKVIPTGQHWDVFEDLIKQVDSSLPGFIVKLILDDCFKYDKPREYLQDIYEYVIKKTPAQTLMNFDQGLLRQFRPFFGGAERPPVANNPRGRTTPMPEVADDFDAGRHDSGLPIQNNYSIASPDGNDEDSGRYRESREEKKITETHKKSVKERLGHRVVPIKPKNTIEQEESYELIPIDKVSKRTSVYKEYLRFFRMDLHNIQQSLKFRNYSRVIYILAGAKNQETQPFAKGFYTILCKKVMESAEHLAAIMKMGGGNEFFEKKQNGHYRIKGGLV